MSGEQNLKKLINQMNPVLNDGEYVFITVNELSVLREEEYIGVFKEKEGTTVIINKDTADQKGMKYENVFSWITLNIHSSLSAVGFTAVVSTALAKYGISCNVVAAYYHDHLFIEKENSTKALDVLQEIQNTFPGI